jgi:hypothetical protein
MLIISNYHFLFEPLYFPIYSRHPSTGLHGVSILPDVVAPRYIHPTLRRLNPSAACRGLGRGAIFRLFIHRSRRHLDRASLWIEFLPAIHQDGHRCAIREDMNQQTPITSTQAGSRLHKSSE